MNPINFHLPFIHCVALTPKARLCPSGNMCDGWVVMRPCTDTQNMVPMFHWYWFCRCPDLYLNQLFFCDCSDACCLLLGFVTARPWKCRQSFPPKSISRYTALRPEYIPFIVMAERAWSGAGINMFHVQVDWSKRVWKFNEQFAFDCCIQGTLACSGRMLVIPDVMLSP
jgi:hypothetical protein